jgi:Integrase core domain
VASISWWRHKRRKDLQRSACEGLRSGLSQGLALRSPNLNAHLERFHRSLNEECLERRIFFGEAALRKAVTVYLAHYL